MFQKVSNSFSLGIIKNIDRPSRETLAYVVHLDIHQENEFAIGIPVFSFGYNSYTYLVESRVLCLIKESDTSKVFILGQVYDSKIARGGEAPREGEMFIGNPTLSRSGLAPFGQSDSFHAYSTSSFFKFDSKQLEMSINDNLSNFYLDKTTFILKVGEYDQLSLKEGTTRLFSNNGIYGISESGGIFLQGQGLSFTEGNTSKERKPAFLISNGLHRFLGTKLLTNFASYEFSSGTGRIVGKSSTVDWDILSGSYSIRLGTGDLKINLLNSAGAEVYFKIGIGPLYLSQFIFDQSSLEVKIGAALPDYLKLGGGEFVINVGNIPGLQSEFLVDGDVGSLKINGLIGSSSYEYKSSSITLKNTGISGSATLEIASGKLTLKSAGKALGGKIVLDGEVEVTGKLTVKGSDGIEATTGDVKAGTISLKQHKHASAVPGGPAPPLPG